MSSTTHPVRRQPDMPSPGLFTATADGAAGAGHVTYGLPCGLCNEPTAQSPGDICGACSLTDPIVCRVCHNVQEQYGPCITCETSR